MYKSRKTIRDLYGNHLGRYRVKRGRGRNRRALGQKAARRARQIISSTGVQTTNLRKSRIMPKAAATEIAGRKHNGNAHLLYFCSKIFGYV